MSTLLLHSYVFVSGKIKRKEKSSSGSLFTAMVLQSVKDESVLSRSCRLCQEKEDDGK